MRAPGEKAAAKVLKSEQAFEKLRDFDRRNMVGRYTGLIYRVKDSKSLDLPLGKATALVDDIPSTRTRFACSSESMISKPSHGERAKGVAEQS